MPLPRDATLVVPGHGWGHGRGMGQWGADGSANAGQNYRTILMHYYSGVSLTTRSPEDIRVLVEQSSDVLVTGDDPFTVSWSNGTLIAKSDSTYRFFRTRYDGSVYRVEKSAAWNGPWTAVTTGGTWVVYTPGPSVLQLVFNSGSVRYYRGKIIARLSDGSMNSIDELPLQQYLYGVVPREMPASWPAEALKSQAVAARTYSVYKKDYARSKNYVYDICATTACQSYAGFASKSSPTSTTHTYLENSSSNNAVDVTAGQVLYYSGKPILAEYSSSSGGYTAQGNVPYQKAVPDPGDSVSPHHDWRATIRVSEVEALWPQIGRLVDVKITKRNGYGDMGGRVLEMELVGTSSTVTITGDDWRNAWAWPTRSNGFRSNWFSVSYWRGELVSAPSSISVTSGETATISALVRNTGNTSWPVGGTVRLSTPQASRFFGPGWISSTRPASVGRNVTAPSSSSVAPGQTAEFRIPIHTDNVPAGTYSQTFTAINDGASTMTPTFAVQIVVLPSWTDEAPNMVTNGSFESNGVWIASGITSGDGITTATKRDGARSFRLAGSGSKHLRQTIGFAGGTGRRFVIGGWNRTDGSSSSGGAVEIRATSTYTDGTTSSVAIGFARASHPWTYDETFFATSASKALRSITVDLSYATQTGWAYFDAVRLLETTVANPSFEDGLAGWSTAGFAGGDGVTSSAARDGYRSLALTGGASKRVTQYIALSGRASERFVLSAWNRVVTSTAGEAPLVTLTLMNVDGTRSVATLSSSASAHEWTLFELAVTAPKTFRSAALTFSYGNTAGTTYFDRIGLVRTWTMNPSFESGLDPWSSYGFSSGDGVTSAAAREGARSLALGGGGMQNVVQHVRLAGGRGSRVIASGWSQMSGTSASRGRVDITLVFRNRDGTSSPVYLNFNKAPHTWGYTEGSAVAPKAFSTVDVYVTFYDETGSAVFDGIRVRSV